LTERLISKQPPADEYQKALYYLGLSHLSLGNYSKAREAFQQLINQRPDEQLFDKAQIGIIDSFNLSGEFQRALDLANDLLKLRPRSEFTGLIYLKMARSNLKLARWDQAKRLLNKIMIQYPDSLEYHLARQLLAEQQFFSVQIGAFLDRKRAENLIKEVKGSGEYGYIVETTDKAGEKFYRVRVGRFSQLDEAQGLNWRLSHLGYPTLIYP
jgi:tetratricopeptide (TPR) repeat protein